MTQKLRNRRALLDLWRARGYLFGCEVGVYRGNFAAQILQTVNPANLALVDPWDGGGMGKVFDGDAIYRDVCARFGNEVDAEIVWIYRDYSPAAAIQFEDRQFDFVYLDARHDYASVLADCRAWLPKVAPGGILAGHDYRNIGRRKQVKRAVDELFGARVNVTGEPGPSWWIEV